MPLHAQILCIGGNAMFALLFLVATQGAFVAGDFGLATFLAALTIAAAYSTWVLLKFRRYLSAEQALEREMHVERLREEIDRLKANNAQEPAEPGS